MTKVQYKSSNPELIEMMFKSAFKCVAKCFSIYHLIFKGNLRNWWEPETMEKFLKKTECIISQYGNFTAEEVNVKLNGINTQGENIADNGGIKEAYRAYSKLALASTESRYSERRDGKHIQH
jgi:hypothetical protein